MGLGRYFDMQRCRTVSTAGEGGSLPGCTVPATRTTALDGRTNTTQTNFNQTIADTAGDNFNGKMLQEGDAAPATDGCWWPTAIAPKVVGG